MTDEDLLARIKADVDEEHALRAAHDGEHPVSDADRDRLGQLEVHLDQMWDLLRQRRAKVAAGEDPDTAGTRPGEVVESYRN
jgi:hypothetical protein